MLRPCCSVRRPPVSQSTPEISPARMADANNPSRSCRRISHIGFGAVQLRQGGRFEKPLPLAQRRSATLARARASTGQGVGTHSQLPGRVWSVWGSKNKSILASREKDLIVEILLTETMIEQTKHAGTKQNHESLNNDITRAAEQVLRSADALSSACERTDLFNKTTGVKNAHPHTPLGECEWNNCLPEQV